MSSEKKCIYWGMDRIESSAAGEPSTCPGLLSSAVLHILWQLAVLYYRRVKFKQGLFLDPFILMDRQTKLTSPLSSCELNFQYFAAL